MVFCWVMFRLTLAPGDWEGHLGWTGRDCLGLAAGTRNGRLQMSPGDHRSAVSMVLEWIC